MLSKPLVDQIQASGGKVVVIGNNYASIMRGDGRRIRRLFVDVPPQAPHPLVGRDEVLADVQAKLSGDDGVAAVSAVNGLPGVGKTALAVGLAYDDATLDHFKGGVLWVGLGPNGDADSALNRWGTALGVELGAASDASARARLLSLALQEKAQGEPVLLIVDDVWRWEQASPFREIAFPGCAHFLTTRDAEIGRKFAGRATSLGELSEAQAEALLAERCPEAKAADAEGLRELARAVGGLPLGLTLIAGELDASVGQARWVREAIERLRAVETRLGLEAPEVRPGLEGVPNTLRAIVELSVAALEPEAQQAFAALGAFAPKPADFSRDAALAIWAMEPGRGDDVLRRLVNRGLLETAGEDRFALHQVLAAVAAVRLGDEKAPQERHAGFYQRFVDEDREAWAKIEAEMEQIRRAWGWIRGAPDKDVETLAYVDALRVFFGRRGLWKEHLEWADCGLSSARALKRVADEASLLHNIGAVHSDLGEKTRALEFYELALLLRRDIGDRAGEATTLNNIGLVHSDLGENKRALEFYELALPLLRAVGDRAGEAATLNNIGAVHRDLGEKTRALEFYERALPLRYNVGDRAGEAVTLYNIARLRDEEGDTAEAISFLERVVEIDEALQHPDLASDRAVLEQRRAKQQAITIQPTPAPRGASRLPWLLAALALLTTITWLIFSR